MWAEQSYHPEPPELLCKVCTRNTPQQWDPHVPTGRVWAHLQPGPVHLRPDEFGQADLHLFPLFNRVEDGVENRDSTFVLEQRHIHHALQTFKRSVFAAIFHDVERLSASQELHAGQFRGGSVVEQVKDDVSLVGGIVRIQRPVVSFASRGSGGKRGFQRLEAGHGNPSPPTACALQITRLLLGEEAALRAAE